MTAAIAPKRISFSYGRRWHLPLEHGAWGMLYVPLLLGSMVGRGFSWRTVTLVVAATFFFLARTPLLAWARSRHWGKPVGTAPRFAMIYLTIAAVAGSPLVLAGGMWTLAGFAAAGTAILGFNTFQGVQR